MRTTLCLVPFGKFREEFSVGLVGVIDHWQPVFPFEFFACQFQYNQIRVPLLRLFSRNRNSEFNSPGFQGKPLPPKHLAYVSVPKTPSASG